MTVTTSGVSLLGAAFHLATGCLLENNCFPPLWGCSSLELCALLVLLQLVQLLVRGGKTPQVQVVLGIPLHSTAGSTSGSWISI